MSSHSPRLLLLFAALAQSANAAITPIDSLSSYDAGDDTGWTAISYSNPALSDPSTDHQTGIAENDLVGSALVPFFYTAFDNNDTGGNLSDGTISFRTRHAGDSGKSGYNGTLTVGIDANSDGRIDGFVGVNNSGSADAIYLWNAGTSSSTTNTSIASLELGTIAAPPYTQTSTNFNFREVETGDLGAGVSLDLDGDAGAKALVDTYLSFSVDFGDLVTLLEDGILANSGEVVTIDENSNFQYIVGTSNNANNFNGDTGGLDGEIGEDTLFSDPNAPTSQPFTPTGSAAVPEPSSTAFIALLGSLFFIRRKR